ncbi:hypothetical protein GCM10019017_06440 [Streptomyces showdoensis]
MRHRRPKAQLGSTIQADALLVGTDAGSPPAGPYAFKTTYPHTRHRIWRFEAGIPDVGPCLDAPAAKTDSSRTRSEG